MKRSEKGTGRLGNLGKNGTFLCKAKIDYHDGSLTEITGITEITECRTVSNQSVIFQRAETPLRNHRETTEETTKSLSRVSSAPPKVRKVSLPKRLGILVSLSLSRSLSFLLNSSRVRRVHGILTLWTFAMARLRDLVLPEPVSLSFI